jgi:hypothetical protein
VRRGAHTLRNRHALRHARLTLTFNGVAPRWSQLGCRSDLELKAFVVISVFVCASAFVKLASSATLNTASQRHALTSVLKVSRRDALTRKCRGATP